MKTIDYKTVRTIKDIRDCPFVDEVFNEGEDGWWVHLKQGYKSERLESGLHHEHTVKKLCESFNEGHFNLH